MKNICISWFLQDMVVHNVGSGLSTVFPDLDGKKITDAFLLARPLVEFTWNMVKLHFTLFNCSLRQINNTHQLYTGS